MKHVRPLVWQPAYCTCGSIPNAIVLDAEFAKLCARTSLTPEQRMVLLGSVNGHLSRPTVAGAGPVFEFLEDSLLVAVVSETTESVRQLELQQLIWKGQETTHHPVYAFTDGKAEPDSAARQRLQGAFAWWAQCAQVQLAYW